MAKKKKRVWIPIVIFLFLLYIFFAAQPIKKEMVLSSQWISSTEAASAEVSGILTPFQLNNRFGYIDALGNILLNETTEGYVSLSDFRWALYEKVPEQIEIKSPQNETVFTLSNPQGYPFFLDNKNFILGKEQNSITSLDDKGTIRWTYDFDAPVTCIDANANLLLVGLLNGTIVLLNNEGNEIYSFDALGSRIAIIYACKISNDGNKLAVISGLDEQRFLLFEQYSDSYRVTYHEYIGEGYRRPVMLSFIDNDRRAAFECEGGIGIYDTQSRNSTMLPLEGRVYAMDNKGKDDVFFVIMSLSAQKKQLVSIRYPGIITGKAPYKTESVFLSRNESALIIGGDKALISFNLEKR